jgi:hypothetical protein
MFIRYYLAKILPRPAHTPQGSRLTLRSFLIAVALDVGFTVYETVAERVAYSSAVPAGAQITAGHSFVQPIGHRRYSFTCSFRDRNGVVQHVWFTLLDKEVPPPIRVGIDGGLFPIPLAVVYDPTWPIRSWPAGLPYSDDNRLFLFSAISLLFSSLLAAFFALPGKWLGGLPPPEVAPFLGAILLLNACGFIQGW